MPQGRNTMIAIVLVLYLMDFSKSNCIEHEHRHPFSDHSKTVLMARYIARRSDYASIATVSTLPLITGLPFTNIKSVVDGSVAKSTGIPYFYLSPFDITSRDLRSNSSCTILLFLEDASFCENKKVEDIDDPRCSRVILSGRMRRVKEGTMEFKFAKSALLERHPAMATYPKGHRWFIAKLTINHIALLDWAGRAKFIRVRDYLYFRYPGNAAVERYLMKNKQQITMASFVNTQKNYPNNARIAKAKPYPILQGLIKPQTAPIYGSQPKFNQNKVNQDKFYKNKFNQENKFNDNRYNPAKLAQAKIVIQKPVQTKSNQVNPNHPNSNQTKSNDVKVKSNPTMVNAEKFIHNKSNIYKDKTKQDKSNSEHSNSNQSKTNENKFDKTKSNQDQSSQDKSNKDKLSKEKSIPNKSNLTDSNQENSNKTNFNEIDSTENKHYLLSHFFDEFDQNQPNHNEHHLCLFKSSHHIIKNESVSEKPFSGCKESNLLGAEQGDDTHRDFHLPFIFYYVPSTVEPPFPYNIDEQIYYSNLSLTENYDITDDEDKVEDASEGSEYHDNINNNKGE